MQRRFLAAVFLLAVALAGCGRSPKSPSVAAPPPNDQSTTRNTASSQTASDVETQPQPADSAPVDPDNDIAAAANESPAPSSGEDSESAAVEPKIPLPVERVVVPLPAGPLVIDWTISIEGATPAAAIDAIVDTGLAALGPARDGRPEWSQVFANPRFANGLFGNEPARDRRQYAELERRYDRNRNGLVDRDELARFITQGRGDGQAVTLSTSSMWRGRNRDSSPTRRLLDADRDGQLSPAEMDAAPGALLGRDRDHDELLSPEDLRDEIDNADDNLSVGEHFGDTAALLGDRVSWKSVGRDLSDRYAVEGRVGPASFPDFPSLFAALDADGDGRIGRDEWSGLATIPAHLVIEAQFAPVAGGAPHLQLIAVDDQLASRATVSGESPPSIGLSLPSAAVEFVLRDQAPPQSDQPAGEALLAQRDANSDGYLEPSEFASSAAELGPFESLDANADGKLYADELTAAARLRTAARGAQVAILAAEQPDALFLALDTDHDGRLTAREIAAAPSRLQQLDRNGDEHVAIAEIPEAICVQLVRGLEQRNDDAFRRPIGQRLVNANAPRWFMAMDRNADGDLSRSEFLGTDEQFHSLDENQDGLVGLHEASPGEELP